MMMNSSVGSIIFTSDDNENFSLLRIEHDEENGDAFLHPVLMGITHSIITEGIDSILEKDDKNIITDDTFKSLESCNELTNCAICFENKKSNIKLKCSHIFCKPCIKKWLTKRSNTCPNCRMIILD